MFIILPMPTTDSGGVKKSQAIVTLASLHFIKLIEIVYHAGEL
jgi:hypothetical protein